MENNAAEATAWTGTELVICAVLQLFLVFIAYKLERSRDPTAISESSWAIFFGLLVIEIRTLGITTLISSVYG